MFKVEGQTVLVAGGAVSVDRSARTGIPYWPNEKFKFANSMLNGFLNQFSKIDIVVTHSCPAEFWPFQFDSIVYKYSQRDDTLIQDLNNDRQEHSQLLKFLIDSDCVPKRWLYGHFHAPNSGAYLGIKYRALDVFEMVELESSKL